MPAWKQCYEFDFKSNLNLNVDNVIIFYFFYFFCGKSKSLGEKNQHFDAIHRILIKSQEIAYLHLKIKGFHNSVTQLSHCIVKKKL